MPADGPIGLDPPQDGAGPAVRGPFGRTAPVDREDPVAVRAGDGGNPGAAGDDFVALDEIDDVGNKKET